MQERCCDGAAQHGLVELDEDGVDGLQGVKFQGAEVRVGFSQSIWPRAIEQKKVRQSQKEKVIQCGDPAQQHEARNPIGILMASGVSGRWKIKRYDKAK